MSALFAFVYHAAAFALVSALVLELALLRTALTLSSARLLQNADMALGISAGLLLALGLIRVDTSRGNNVLAHILGSKDASGAVADNAASASGLQPSLLKKMLPMMAMTVAGYMAKQGGIGGGLAPRPDGLGGLAGMLGMGRAGNPLDDILRMAGRR